MLDSQEVKAILLPRGKETLQGTQFLCSFQPLGKFPAPLHHGISSVSGILWNLPRESQMTMSRVLNWEIKEEKLKAEIVQAQEKYINKQLSVDIGKQSVMLGKSPGYLVQ